VKAGSKPDPADVEAVLQRLEAAADDVRVTFLCILAHSLTVEIRAALLDRPVSDVAAEHAYRVNEWLHQLTSCVNPKQRRSAVGDAELVRSILGSAEIWGLQTAVRRGLATAAHNTIDTPSASRPTVAAISQ
jgi:hypothetical protein